MKKVFLIIAIAMLFSSCEEFMYGSKSMEELHEDSVEVNIELLGELLRAKYNQGYVDSKLPDSNEELDSLLHSISVDEFLNKLRE